MNWAIYPSNFLLKQKNNLTNNIIVGDYTISYNNQNCKIYLNQNNKEGIIIQGFVLPRLNYNNYSDDLFAVLLDGIKKNGIHFVNNFKGNFVIIAFFKDTIIICNDQFGVGKYFYIQNSNFFLASDHINFFKKNYPLTISKKNIIQYFIFNYFVNGITIYNECKFAVGGNYHVIEKNIIQQKYFSIENFIDERKIIFSKKDSIEKAAELWKQLMKQYIDYFKNKNISQTLTAGMDSRMILAGFRVNNFSPLCFTFGKADSLDVVHAKKIAQKLNLQHYHYYSEDSFFNEYEKYAKEVVQLSSGLASIYRAHRLQAYKNIHNQTNTIFFGFIGSEIIRGLYPDGLTLPKIVSDYWLYGDFSLNHYYPVEWFSLSNEEIEEIKKEILNFDFIDRPDLFLFRMMIPLHFGQDIKLCESLNIDAVAPYWDIDFLDFQKNTPFFTDNDRKEDFAKIGHYQRRKGPFFSAKIITLLDKQNARLSLGKGYSPLDYNKSLYYAAFKFALYKTIYKKRYQVPNFDYQQWFKKYLAHFFEKHKIDFIIGDNQDIHRQILNINGIGEFDYLKFVKLINLYYMHYE